MCGEPGLEHLAVRQRVGDVAGDGELLDPLRDRRVRRRLESAGVGRLVARRHDVDAGVLLEADDRHGVDRVRVVGGLLAPLAELAVGEHRAVVGRVAEVGVDRVVEGAAATHLDRLGRLAVVVGLDRSAAEHPVAEGAEALGQAVEGRRGDDEEAEESKEKQQRHHDVRRPQQVEQQRRDHEADRATTVAQRRGVTQDGLGAAVGDVHDAEHAEGQRRPADDLATGGTVADGVAHDAPAGEHDHQRHEPADLADRAGDDVAHQLHHAAGHLEPHGRGHDDRDAEEEQAGAVATVVGVELASAAADAAGSGADRVGHAEPDRGDGAEERLTEPGDRAGTVADRAGRHVGGRQASWPRTCRGSWWASGRSGIGCSSRLVPCRPTRSGFGMLTCSCSANPAGKTYGSPW